MIQDIRQQVYDRFVDKKIIDSNHIHFHLVPENREKKYPLIVINPMQAPQTGVHGSNKELSMQLTLDIHVQGKTYKSVKEIAYQTHQAMLAMGFGQLPGGLDDFIQNEEKTTYYYVDVRRYRINTKLHDTNY